MATHSVPCNPNPLLGKSQHDLLIDIACSLRRLVVIMSGSPVSGANFTWQALGGAAPDNGDGSNGDHIGDSDTAKIWHKSGGVWVERGQMSSEVDDAAAKFVTPTQGELGATLA